MIYLIFTSAGFEQANVSILEDKAGLWINVDVLSDTRLDELKAADVDVQFLPELIKASDEKGVLRAIEHVEQYSADAELLVEYV